MSSTGNNNSSSNSSSATTTTSVQRTAPIPIAPKPPRPDPAANRTSDLPRRLVDRLDIAPGGGLLHARARAARGPADPVSVSAPTPSTAVPGRGSQPAPPCRACRYAGSRCIPSEDEDGCISCQVNAAECSLSSASPRSRKRKLGDHHHLGGFRDVRDDGDDANDDDGEADDDHYSSSAALDAGGRGQQSHRHHLNSSNGHGHGHGHGGGGGSSTNPNSNSLSSTAATSSSFLEDMANVGGPTMLKRTLGLQDDRYSQYIGPTTDFEPSLINLSPFDPQDESLLSRGTLRKVSDDDTFLMLPDYSTPGHEHLVQDLDDIEAVVAPHGPRLVDLYFRIIHPGFPIIQKHVFLEKYDRSYREFSPPILAAVYILSINWWEHDAELARLPRPDVTRLERLMRATLADAMYRPKLSTVQAGLLLSQRPEGDQWAPTAQVVAVAQELGLHLDCSPWRIPPWEKGLRKRLAWALYMQDKWGSLVHGRPSHIFPSNWGVRALTANDFPDVEWDEDDVEEKQDIERGRLVFTRAVQLSEILAEILETFYTLDAAQNVSDAGPQGTQMVLSLAKPIQLKLKDWYGNLPNSIRLDSASSLSLAASPSNRFTCIGYLHLAYFAAEITLHRRIIRSLAATATATDPYVQNICRSAAKARLISAMDFVNRLGPVHLRSFWYFASKTNFALIGTFGSLLWATSPGREEAEWYRRRLSEYRWTLSVSAKPGEGSGLTAFAMTMLDISTGLLNQLPEKPSMSRSGSTADVVAGAAPAGWTGAAPTPLSGLAGFGTGGVQSPESGRYSSDDDMDDYGAGMQ